MSKPKKQLARAWADHAGVMTRWAGERLMSERRPCLVYPPLKRLLKGEGPALSEGQVTDALLGAHFAARDLPGIVAVCPTSGEGTTRVLTIALDRSGPGASDGAVTQGHRFQAALHWSERLRERGFETLLEETDGFGGYRVWVLFEEPADASVVGAFAAELTADFADHGLMAPPRVVPGGSEGAWLPLPGLQPSGAWSRVWSGSASLGHDGWLSGASAAEAFMRLAPSAVGLLRVSRSAGASERRGVEPTLTEDGRQWVTAAESERVRGLLAQVDELLDELPTGPEVDDADAVAEPVKPGRVELACARAGLTREELRERAEDWLVRQNDDVLALVLGLHPSVFDEQPAGAVPIDEARRASDAAAARRIA